MDLGVVSPPSRGAGVHPKTGIAVDKLVPVAVISLNMEVFKSSQPILGFVVFPAGHGIEVEILAVYLYLEFLYKAVDVVNKPVESLLV